MSIQDITYESFKEDWFLATDSIICYTSGSTGIPKEIYLPKKEMILSAKRTCDYFNITSTSHLHSCISPNYIGGKMMFVRSVVSGARFSYEMPSNSPFKEPLNDYIDLVSVVPSQMIHILEHQESTRNIGHFLIGGAPLSSKIRNGIIAKGLSAFESYGMTETASHIALRQVREGEDWFKTLPGITVFPHIDNRLGIRIEGWSEFLTNDIAEIKSENSFRILGRADNVINTGGKKVFPENIEYKIAKDLDFPFYISSRKDDKWGEQIVLVVHKSDKTEFTEKKILEICRKRLSSWEVPKEIIGVDHFALTLNGKIKRSKF